MKRLLLLNCTLLLLICIGCNGKKIEIKPNEPIGIQIPGYVPTRTEVRSAVVAASHSLGWRAVDRAPGLVHVIYKMRGRESLVLEVDFSEVQFTINYAGSSKSSYNAQSGKVHPYFESNAEKLRLAIEKQLPKLLEPAPMIVVKPSVSLDFNNTAILAKQEREIAKKRAEEQAEAIKKVRLAKAKVESKLPASDAVSPTNNAIAPTNDAVSPANDAVTPAKDAATPESVKPANSVTPTVNTKPSNVNQDVKPMVAPQQNRVRSGGTSIQVRDL